MNDGTLEEKYQIKIAVLEDNSLNQNIVVAINEHHENQILHELYQFIENNNDRNN